MRLIISFIIFFLLHMVGVGQNNIDGAGHKGQLHFDVGLEYRVTPIYGTDTSILDETTSFINRDAQNSGPAVNLGFEYYIFENLSIGFVNSFRYDMVISEPPSFPEGENENITVRKSLYGLLYDYQFKLAYYVKLSARERLFVDLGYTFMNRNSDFILRKKIFDQNGEHVGYGRTVSNYSYNGNRLFLGYSKDKLKLQLGMYLSTTTPYFDEGNPSFIVPTIGITYNAFRF